MEKILVSKSKIAKSVRNLIGLACILICLCGFADLLLRGENASDRLRIFLYPIGLFVFYSSYVLFYIIGFFGGTFYISHERVGIKLPLRKIRSFSWDEIEECGVIQLNNMSVAYFATRHVPIEEQIKVFNGNWGKGINWMAFAEFDINFIEKVFPYLPAEFADTMHNHARFEGLGSSSQILKHKPKPIKEVKGSFYNGDDPRSKVSLIVDIALVLIFSILAYIFCIKGILDGGATSTIDDDRILRIIMLVLIAAFLCLPIMDILNRYLYVSINKYGISYRYCFAFVRTIPWRDLWNTRITEIPTKDGPKTVVLFAINSRTGKILSDEKKLCIFADEAFINELKQYDVIVHDDREENYG